MTAVEPIDVSELVIGLIGGTGPQGKGLAWRLAAAGQQVLVGSRDAARAAAVAADLSSAVSTAVRGADNATVAREADLVVITVPWEGHRAIIESLRAELAGKVVVDCVNPIGADARGAYALDVPEGSAAEQAQAILTDSTVVGAFHHVSAPLLSDPTRDRVDTDVLVLGDDRQATDTVQALAGRIPGMRGIYGGRLRNCGQVEALTANLIAVNRRYKAHAGLRVTDV